MIAISFWPFQHSISVMIPPQHIHTWTHTFMCVFVCVYDDVDMGEDMYKKIKYHRKLK